MQLICKEWVWVPQDSGLCSLRNRPKMTKIPSGHIRYFEARIDRSGTISRTGYGRRIPTGYMVKHFDRWHRVYACNFGNWPTLYIGPSAAPIATVSVEE